MTNPIDQAVQDWMVDHRSPWLTHVAWAVTFLGTTVFVSIAVLAIGVVLSWRRRSGLPVVVLALTDLAVECTARGLKRVIGRPRPPAAQAIEHLANSSMPAAHVARCALWCTLVVLAVPRAGRRLAAAVTVVLVAAVAWSRVYLGSHWLTDTLVAWPVGVAAAWLAGLVVAKTGDRHRAVQPVGSALE